MRRLSIAVVACLWLIPEITVARERLPFEGVWAATDSECQDEEGPNTRNLTDMSAAKVGPLFDQYENHCRITKAETVPNGHRLNLRCYEFWEDFQKEKATQYNGDPYCADASENAREREEVCTVHSLTVACNNGMGPILWGVLHSGVGAALKPLGRSVECGWVPVSCGGQLTQKTGELFRR